MQKRNYKALIIIWLVTLIIIAPATFAQSANTIYVDTHTRGTGNGSSPENAINGNSGSTFVISGSLFGNGSNALYIKYVTSNATYNMTYSIEAADKTITIMADNSVSGVKLSPASGFNIVKTTSTASRLNVTVQDICIENLSTTTNNTDGSSSLFNFQEGSNNSLNINNVIFNNISSGQQPVFRMASGTVNINSSTLNYVNATSGTVFKCNNKNVTFNLSNTTFNSCSSKTAFFSMEDESRGVFSVDNCTFNDNNATSGDFFYLNSRPRELTTSELGNYPPLPANYEALDVTINNCRFTGNKASNHFIYTWSNYSTVRLTNTTLRNNASNDHFIYHKDGAFQVEDCLFESNEVAISNVWGKALFHTYEWPNSPVFRNTSFVSNRIGSTSKGGEKSLLSFDLLNWDFFESIIIHNCIFSQNAILSSSGDTHVINVKNIRYSNPVDIVGCAFINNQLSGGSRRNVMHFDDFTEAYIVNNTFSGNSGTTEAVWIYGGASWNNAFYLVNNTFFNSGNIITENSKFRCYNNLLFGTSTTISAPKGVVKRNIAGNTFFANGVSGGVALGNITDYVYSTLDVNTQTHHQLVPSVATNAIIGKGGAANAVGDATVESYLTIDQVGKTRPAFISAGSIDSDFCLNPGPVYRIPNTTF